MAAANRKVETVNCSFCTFCCGFQPHKVQTIVRRVDSEEVLNVLPETDLI